MVLFSFEYPVFLWFLLLLPFFVFIYFWGLGYNNKRALVFSNFHALERFYGIEFFSKNFLALYFNLLILFLLILSLAGLTVSYAASGSAFSYVLLVDSSSSMSSTDISPSRLVAASRSAQSFLGALPLGVPVGVVRFGGDSEILSELTTDRLLISQGISRIDYSTVGGTNIYNAVVTAGRMFDEYNKSGELRSIVLLSDGQVNVGEADDIVDYAKQNNIIIHSIAIGTEEGGETALNYISKADIDFLKAISFETGGQFYSVDSTGAMTESMDAIVSVVDTRVHIALSVYLLIAALFFFILDWIFYNLRFRIYP